MKRVIIVRHAKAVPYGYDDDFSRDLTERGITDAAKISKRLKELNITPDWMIASPASRTMHTANVFCENLNYESESIKQIQRLYEGITTQRFVDILHELPEHVNTVIVFGHNPTVHQLAYNLATHFTSDMPTCSTVVLDFQVDFWKELSARTGKLTLQLTPKEL